MGINLGSAPVDIEDQNVETLLKRLLEIDSMTVREHRELERFSKLHWNAMKLSDFRLFLAAVEQHLMPRPRTTAGIPPLLGKVSTPRG